MMEGKRYEFVITEQHTQLMQTIMSVMEAFYGNDLLPILKEVGTAYHAQPSAAKNMAELIKSLSITYENLKMKRWVQNLKALPYRVITSPSEGANLNKALCLTDIERQALIKILDTYSRVMMGQLFIIFEALDIPSNDQELEEQRLRAWHDAYWKGCMGLRDAKAQLIPETSNYGWRGGYGICNQKVSLSSRLAYEMLKILDKDIALKVTDVPLPYLKIIE